MNKRKWRHNKNMRHRELKFLKYVKIQHNLKFTKKINKFLKRLCQNKWVSKIKNKFLFCQNLKTKIFIKIAKLVNKIK